MIKSSSIFIFCLVTINLSCYSQNNKMVNVSVLSPTRKYHDVQIRITNMLNSEVTTIAKATSNSFGSCSLKFECPLPTFATLKIDEEPPRSLYLEPGYNLRVLIENKVDFSGDGADMNNYLAGVDRIFNRLPNIGDKDKETTEFAIYLDNLKDSVLRFHRHFLNRARLPISMIALLEKQNNIKILLEREAYQWNYGIAHDFDVPKDIDVTSEIPFDSAVLQSGMFEYARILDIYLDIKRRLLLKSIPAGQKHDIMRIAPITFMGEFNEHAYSNYMRGFMKVKNVDYFLYKSYEGITPTIDSLYHVLKNEQSPLPYFSSLERQYNNLSRLTKGNIAPTIKGVTQGGDTVTTDAMRGRVVHIDIWASWCQPCVYEIPYSKKLQEFYKENSNVVFLNASVDSNKEDWERALSKYGSWNGIHILNDRSIYYEYSFNSIPKYILIDKEGKIVSASAPRPSSGLVEAEIQNLLNK